MLRVTPLFLALVCVLATVVTGCGDDLDDSGDRDAAAPPSNGCSYVPAECTELLPADAPEPAQGAKATKKLPQPVAGCFVARKGGLYVHEYVNVVKGGALYFEEDATKDIDFRVKSMLVEQGGLVQAGALGCGFGASGKRLRIGLYGDDPTAQGSVPKDQLTDRGIQCETSKDDPTHRCMPAHPPGENHYCVGGGAPDDPCASTTPPVTDGIVNGKEGKNFLLEHYGDLNFDASPFGYKVLGVGYGGSLLLFGDKGARGAAAVEGKDSCRVPTDAESTLDASEMRAWAKLSGTSWVRLDGQSDEGDETVLTLDRMVDGWGEGDDIVVATTDWYPGHSEQRRITKVDVDAAGKTTLRVARLEYPHVAKLFDVGDVEQQGGTFTGTVNRKAADLRAPVGLLSRSIQVRSLGKGPEEDFPAADKCMAGTKDPSCIFGGHVLFRQGFRQVQVQGVEFKQLGQGGRMGHYPVHFHLAKSTKYTEGRAFVRDSAIWDSMTRFVTLHGSHDIDISRNVGFLSTGHGFYAEDATEINNRFCHNLGVGARAAMNEYYAGQKTAFEAKRAAYEKTKTAADPPLEAPATVRVVPPILDGTTDGYDDGNPAARVRGFRRKQRMGSDGLMPVMYWMMNAYNELVGNQSSGVYGFGSCYWLLGSGVSGASQDHQLDGLAAYNGQGGQQAPVLRFRGNGCSTASIALSAQVEIAPSSGQPIGFTEMKNPYLFRTDGVTEKSIAELKDGEHFMFERPIVPGNFKPIQPGAEQSNCASSVEVQNGKPGTELARNVSSCAMTHIDRFTTSYNWTEVNFGSVWLRPWFYVFANGAVTDQLFGGLTFVTAGSWIQVPPAYFSLAQNNLFVGTTQYAGSPIGDSPFAKRSGPILRVKADTPLQPTYAPCAPPKNTCNFDEEGVGYWQGSLQPKRLLNIYDGPAHADGNTFLNIGAWECDPQPCEGTSPDDCRKKLPLLPDGSGDREFACGVYASTRQPSPVAADPDTNPATFKEGKYHHRMIVLDAAIGWKQPNGFYYPPAFGHANNVFLATPPALPGAPGLTNGLNQCFVAGGSPELVPGDCRHYAMDRTQVYVEGLLYNPTGPSSVLWPTHRAPFGQLSTTPVDFQTILIDTDGSLTGATGKLGATLGMPTSSVSRNRFFDAPAQDEECLSYGVQTSPYTFATTTVAKLVGSPKAGPTSVERKDPPWQLTPMVPIYRQWMLAKDREPGEAPCGDVCSATDPLNYGCARASFMMGSSIGQAPHLTMSVPDGSGQPGALYYIDTNSANQATNCLGAGKTGDTLPATFLGDNSYALYNLFARPDTKTSYSLYVGDSVTDLAAIKMMFIRVDPHAHAQGTPDFYSYVTPDCDPTSGAGWCAGGTYAKVDSGILTVTLDNSVIKDDFLTSRREEHDRCMPRDMCFFDGSKCAPCVKGLGGVGADAKFEVSPACTGNIFRPDDFGPLLKPDASGKSPLENICDWSTRSSGTVDGTKTERVFVDCPGGGCLGFAFTLPSGFTPKPYSVVNPPMAAGPAAPACFDAAKWSGNALQSRKRADGALADPLCGATRSSMPADFCGP